jgi:hypothetical protein
VASDVQSGKVSYVCNLIELQVLVLWFTFVALVISEAFWGKYIYVREEHKLRVFENRVLRRMFGPKRDRLAGAWRKLHNEELHSLYSSPSIIIIIKLRRMRWAEHVARMGEKRNVYMFLIGKPERKRPLGRPRRWWIDNIKMDLLEIGLSAVYWIGLGQDRYRWRALVNSVMHLRPP